MKETIEVNAYAGYKGNEKPRSFKLGSNDYQIKKIIYQELHQSLTNSRRSQLFRVLCQNNQQFDIIYDMQLQQWFLFSKDQEHQS